MKDSTKLHMFGINIFDSIPNYSCGTKNIDSEEIKNYIKSNFADENDFKNLEKDMDEHFYLGYQIAKNMMFKEFKKEVKEMKEKGE